MKPATQRSGGRGVQALATFNTLVTNWMAATINDIALVVEICGVIAVLIALGNGLSPFLLAFFRIQRWTGLGEVRRRVESGLVLCLEIFVAADLLRTLPNPNLEDVIVLGSIAFLRTILGLSLEYELHRLP